MSQQTERSFVVRNIAIGSTIVIAVAAVVLLWNRGLETGPGLPLDEGPVESAVPAEVEGDAATAPVGLGPAQADLARRWAKAVGQPPKWPDDFSDPVSCEQVELELARACTALDARVAASGSPDLGGACVLRGARVLELVAAGPRKWKEKRWAAGGIDLGKGDGAGARQNAIGLAHGCRHVVQKLNHFGFEFRILLRVERSGFLGLAGARLMEDANRPGQLSGRHREGLRDREVQRQRSLAAAQNQNLGDAIEFLGLDGRRRGRLEEGSADRYKIGRASCRERV